MQLISKSQISSQKYASFRASQRAAACDTSTSLSVTSCHQPAAEKDFFFTNSISQPHLPNPQPNSCVIPDSQQLRLSLVKPKPSSGGAASQNRSSFRRRDVLCCCAAAATHSPGVTRSVFIMLVTLLWVSRTAVTEAPTLLCCV